MTTTASDVQFDHGQWLHDINRWNYYQQSWQAQAQGMMREYRRLQAMVEQYVAELEEFGEEVCAHHSRLLFDGRAVIERSSPVGLDDQLVKSHALNAARHTDLYKTHERLQQMQQNLAMGLAVLNPECFSRT